MTFLVFNTNPIENVYISNINSKKQLVFAGIMNDLLFLETQLKERFEENIKIVKLNVQGAFHTKYMDEAANTFEQYLNTIEFHHPKYPVLTNYNDKLYMKEDVVYFLSQQINHTVNWLNNNETLNRYGVTQIIDMDKECKISNLSLNVVEHISIISAENVIKKLYIPCI